MNVNLIYAMALFEKIQRVAVKLWENHQTEITGFLVIAAIAGFTLLIVNEK